MTIELELNKLVNRFSPFDINEARYTAELDKNLNKKRFLNLEEQFIICLNNQLLENGTQKEAIDKCYRKLRLLLHPDKTSHYSPEIIWLDKTLSGDLEKGGCFKILSFCYEQLTDPNRSQNSNHFKEPESNGINNMEDLKKWVRKHKNKSKTYAAKNLCDSLISLIDESSDFFDASGKIKPSAVKKLVRSIPILIAGFGITLFLEEILLVYVVYFFLLKGGRQLQESDHYELKIGGKLLEKYIGKAGLITTSLLVRLFELIFWTTRNVLTISLDIGSSFFSSKPIFNKEDVDVDEIANELIVANERTQSGRQFKSSELKLIAKPFEKYQEDNDLQWFRFLRVGEEKSKKIKKLLFDLHVLDNLNTPLEEKYIDIVQSLNKIKQDEVLYTDTTKIAVDYAEETINALRSLSDIKELSLQASESNDLILAENEALIPYEQQKDETNSLILSSGIHLS